MVINQDVLNWLKSQPIGKDKNIDIAKGLNQFPFTLHQINKFIKFKLAYPENDK